MAMNPMPKGFTEAIDELNNSLFWTARAIENLSDWLADHPMDADLVDTLHAMEEYDRLGHPLGKSKRGLKKWRKRYYQPTIEHEILTDILDAEYLTDPKP